METKKKNPVDLVLGIWGISLVALLAIITFKNIDDLVFKQVCFICVANVVLILSHWVSKSIKDENILMGRTVLIFLSLVYNVFMIISLVTFLKSTAMNVSDTGNHPGTYIGDLTRFNLLFGIFSLAINNGITFPGYKKGKVLNWINFALWSSCGVYLYAKIWAINTSLVPFDKYDGITPEDKATMLNMVLVCYLGNINVIFSNALTKTRFSQILPRGTGWMLLLIIGAYNIFVILNLSYQFMEETKFLSVVSYCSIFLAFFTNYLYGFRYRHEKSSFKGLKTTID